MDIKTEMLAIMAKLDECLERVDHLIIEDQVLDGKLSTLSDDLSTAHDSAKEIWKRS